MSPDEAIATIAAKQYGAFHHAQAVHVGLTADAIEWRVDAGRWRAPYVGVYVIAGAPATWEQRIITAVFAYGGNACASHTTAGHVLSIVERPPVTIHVSLPRSQHRERRGTVIPHQATLRRNDIRLVRGIWVTAPNRTLVDLAGVLDQRGLEAALDDAIQLRLTTIPSLQRYIADRNLTHNRGVAKLRRLLADRADGAMHKALERMFRRKATAAGLPAAKRQFPVGPYKVDFAWPEQRIVVELDGLGGHFSAESSRRDKRRDRFIVRAGYTPLHFCWEDIADEWPRAEADIRAVLLASVARPDGAPPSD